MATVAVSDARAAAVAPNRFDYLLERIRSAPFVETPFRHIEIFDFLAEEHFAAIIGSEQIALTSSKTTEALLNRLGESGYEPIPFPGCVTSEAEYLDWFHGRTKKSYHAATEGFGIVYRLTKFRDSLLSELDDFFHSEALSAVMREKFEIDRPVSLDGGIQKYLHGYEISPHPDIRRKALTWMLNINPGVGAETADYHTHYLRLKDQWKFISEFWKHNEGVDRDWLPWDWCDTVKRQPKNNSIVIFQPENDTIHAVKANYDHLPTQRTQLYGNLWYELVKLPNLPHQEFRLVERAKPPQSFVDRLRDASATQALKASPVGSILRTLKPKTEKKHVRKVDF